MALPIRAQSRSIRRARAMSRVSVPVSEAQRAADPLLRTSAHARGRAAFVAALMIAAILIHGFAVVVFYGIGFASRLGRTDRIDPNNEAIEVAMIEPPPPVPEPEPEGEPEPEPVIEPVEEPEPPPPDPIDVPDTPPPPPTAPPPRRVVGISLESTVQGGAGPGFSVGNTRMGRSEKKAAAPETVKKLDKPAPAPNRIARRIPQAGVKLVKPKKIGPRIEPEYPPDLKAQNLEANVVVEVLIAADGRVRRVNVIAPSPHAAFNQAAVKAAKSQRWSPAQRRGQPIEFTVTYTVRFRLKD